MCKITISTGTYNREDLLPRAINSVLGQTFSDFEYIIINNGSTDGTQALIDRYCKEDKRIRAVSFPTNRMDTQATYDKYRLYLSNSIPQYHMYVDDDDFMEPETVETLYRLIVEYDADIASVGSMYAYPDGTKKNKFVFEGTYVYSRIDAMTEMLKREKFNAAAGGKLFKKSLYHDLFLPDVSQSRDIYSRYRIMNKICKMVVTGTPLYYFYRHDSNMSGLDTAAQITPERMRQHLEANAMRTEWLSEHMPEIKDFVFYCELSFMISLYERIYRLDVQPCFDIAQEMRDTIIKNLGFLNTQHFCTEQEKEILSQIEEDNIL